MDSFSAPIRVHISALLQKLRAVLGYDPAQPHPGKATRSEESTMKRLSLQWRITLLTALLIAVCLRVCMNLAHATPVQPAWMPSTAL